MVTQTINPLSAQRDLSKTGLKTTSIYRVDQDLFYVPKPTLNSALILPLEVGANFKAHIVTQEDGVTGTTLRLSTAPCAVVVQAPGCVQ